MEGLTAFIPHLKAALTEARQPDLARIQQGLQQFGLMGVHGEAEVGTTSVVEAALRASQQPHIRIDLDGATGDDDVAWLLARGIARIELGPAGFSLMHTPEALRPTSARKAFIAFAEKVGERVAALAIAERPTADVDILEILDAYERAFHGRVLPPALWVDHLQAPALTPRHPLDVDRLLWNIRAFAQRAELPIILSGNKAATPIAFGPSRAFHGDGVWITLGRPGLDAWRSVAESLDERAPAGAWVEEMAEITHSHPATMLLALSLYAEMPERARRPLDLWQLMLVLDDGHTGRLMQHARSLHRLGGQIVEQIATGNGPYTAAKDANAVKEIHRAVRRLHEAGIITQPRPRAWEVANPLVAARLRRNLPLTTREAVGTEAYDWTGP